LYSIDPRENEIGLEAAIKLEDFAQRELDTIDWGAKYLPSPGISKL